MYAMNLLLVSTQCIHLYLFVSEHGCVELQRPEHLLFLFFACLLLHEKALDMFYVLLLVGKLSGY